MDEVVLNFSPELNDALLRKEALHKMLRNFDEMIFDPALSENQRDTIIENIRAEINLINEALNEYCKEMEKNQNG